MKNKKLANFINKENSIINIIGAKEHNLKSVDVQIPKNSLVIITGPSGSGKSSLALDTIYAEGKRRYVESLSSYARQFLGVSKRPNVEKIEGLCPAIAIEQKTVGYNPRSTVGTITEIYDYLRVLFARIGTPHCPSCQMPIKAESPENITNMLLQNFKDQNITIGAPIAIEKKGEFKKELLNFFNSGFYRFLIDGKTYRFADIKEIENLNLKKTYTHNISILIDNLTVQQEEVQRLQEAIEKAFLANGGLCNITNQDNNTTTYSSKRICLNCVRSFPELEPRFFSFNSPIGACPECHGLGFTFQEAYLEYYFKNQKEKICESCTGKRLKEEALAVTINKKNIYEISCLSIEKALEFFNNLKLNGHDQKIAESLLREIISRLTFLQNVGLSYLTLSRMARTLSGGEGQRIRLATQIGSALSGVIYILDEPSIGLHQKDNDRLIDTLKTLKNLGNTVLVVEHDMDTIKNADYLIDVGPGAGVLGGKITACGTPKELSQNSNSLTGKYISGELQIKTPEHRRKPLSFLTIKNATANNLKNIDVDIPLGILSAICGVSGSGKSSLIIQTLAPALQNYFAKGYAICKNADELLGIQQLSNFVLVDQSPIGKTPRSNPATYLGIFDDIRYLYANLPESIARGYNPGRFSFNVSNGRCFECSGEGFLKISMHFLEDVIIRCKSCKGQKYNQQTLEIKYINKNISQILDMTVLQALDFFKNHTQIHKKLDLLCQVGLDYIKLGQPSTTLSGGEAQRIKLVNELSKRGKNTMYILDEPTTGLHNCDIEKLLLVLNKLVNRGNSVVVIEHNLDVLKSADYLIEIGPEGGDKGGYVTATGTPERVSKHKQSITGQYLKNQL
ncbi:MAG: excinuclease ABC subunit UvrA [Candidatus Babeliales bacterium]